MTYNLNNIFSNLTATGQQVDSTSTLITTIIALGMIIIIFMILLILAVYIYTSIALMTIAKKTKTKHAWMAWIPILNFYLITQIAKQSGLWTLIVLAVFVPFGFVAFLAIYGWMFWLIAKRRKLQGWLGLLMIIPVVNLVMIGIIAWKKK